MRLSYAVSGGLLLAAVAAALLAPHQDHRAFAASDSPTSQTIAAIAQKLGAQDPAEVCRPIVLGPCTRNRNPEGDGARCRQIHTAASKSFQAPTAERVDYLVKNTGSFRTWCALTQFVKDDLTCMELGVWINGITPQHKIENLHARCSWKKK